MPCKIMTYSSHMSGRYIRQILTQAMLGRTSETRLSKPVDTIHPFTAKMTPKECALSCSCPEYYRTIFSLLKSVGNYLP